jgi:hypothetical protein
MLPPWSGLLRLISYTAIPVLPVPRVCWAPTLSLSYVVPGLVPNFCFIVVTVFYSLSLQHGSKSPLFDLELAQLPLLSIFDNKSIIGSSWFNFGSIGDWTQDSYCKYFTTQAKPLALSLLVCFSDSISCLCPGWLQTEILYPHLLSRWDDRNVPQYPAYFLR